MTVTEIRRETRDAVVLSLAIPAEHRDAFRFIQGQYLTFRATIDGEEVRRSYSICAGADDGVCRVGDQEGAGRACSRLGSNETLRPGQQLEAMPPDGQFPRPARPGQPQAITSAFAAGSGITPLLSIIKTTLAREPHSRFSLFYGNRASSTIMFREELEDLKNEHLSRLSITHILSREHQELELFNGRIGRAKCAQLFAHWLDVAHGGHGVHLRAAGHDAGSVREPAGTRARPAPDQVRAVRRRREPGSAAARRAPMPRPNPALCARRR